MKLKKHIVAFVLTAFLFLPTFGTAVFAENLRIYPDVRFDLDWYANTSDKKGFLADVIKDMEDTYFNFIITSQDFENTDELDSKLTEALEWLSGYEKRVRTITILGYYNIKPFEKLAKFSVLDELHISRYPYDAPKTVSYKNFVDLPAVKSLMIDDGNRDISELVKHFPNMTSFYPDSSNDSMKLMTAVIKNCKKIQTYQGEKLRDHATYQAVYDRQLRSKIEDGDYTKSTKVGKIKGKFLITVITDGSIDAYRGSELDEYFAGEDLSDRYATSTNDCDTYILFTVESKYVDTYNNKITKGYSRTWYVQIYDLKNKIAYKKELLTVVQPPDTISYYAPPSAAYPEAPIDKLKSYLMKKISD
jgi:hypothetical protein